MSISSCQNSQHLENFQNADLESCNSDKSRTTTLEYIALEAIKKNQNLVVFSVIKAIKNLDRNFDINSIISQFCQTLANQDQTEIANVLSTNTFNNLDIRERIIFSTCKALADVEKFEIAMKIASTKLNEYQSAACGYFGDIMQKAIKNDEIDKVLLVIENFKRYSENLKKHSIMIQNIIIESCYTLIYHGRIEAALNIFINSVYLENHPSVFSQIIRKLQVSTSDLKCISQDLTVEDPYMLECVMAYSFKLPSWILELIRENKIDKASEAIQVIQGRLDKTLKLFEMNPIKEGMKPIFTR